MAVNCRYSVGDDTLWGVNRRRMGIAPTTLSRRGSCTAGCAGATRTLGTPEVLAAQRREHARVRSEKGIAGVGEPVFDPDHIRSAAGP